MQLVAYFRKEIMGVCALMILVCHASTYIKMPYLLDLSLSSLEVAVDIFLMLSGLGIYFSLFNYNGGVLKWYKKRFLRLYIPYLLIIIPILLIRIKLGIFKNTDTLYILSYLSTFQFYVDHNGIWFLSMLVPLYLISPFLYKIVNNLLFTILLLIIIAFLLLLLFNSELINKSFVDNLFFVIVRIPSFIFGMLVAKCIKQKKDINNKLLIPILVILSIGLFALTKQKVFSYCLISYPCVCLITSIVQHICNRGRRFLNFFGDISLESYVCNVSIPPILFFILKQETLLGSVILYVISIILGTFMSYLCQKLSSKILFKVL